VQKTTPEDSDIDEEEPEQPEQSEQDTDSSEDDTVPEGEVGLPTDDDEDSNLLSVS
jgi:hypothetical protein